MCEINERTKKKFERIAGKRHSSFSNFKELVMINDERILTS